MSGGEFLGYSGGLSRRPNRSRVERLCDELRLDVARRHRADRPKRDPMKRHFDLTV